MGQIVQCDINCKYEDVVVCNLPKTIGHCSYKVTYLECEKNKNSLPKFI
jgi:hypothetical protein